VLLAGAVLVLVLVLCWPLCWPGVYCAGAELRSGSKKKHTHGFWSVFAVFIIFLLTINRLMV